MERYFESRTFINDLMMFYRESMQWCCDESEKAAVRVSDILNILMEDAERVSMMSKETLSAVAETRTKIKKLQSSADFRKSTHTLIAALEHLKNQNTEVSDLVAPIIESLQFQDRIRQKMENVANMFKFWQEERAKALVQGEFGEDAKLELGKRLLDCTTMTEEREAIRARIDGLPDEEEAHEDVMMF